MKIDVHLNTLVESYDGEWVTFKGGEKLRTRTLIWAAGVRGNVLPGIPESLIKANGRIQVDQQNRVESYDGVYVLGDLAYMEEPGFERGHPQVAQVAIQQADALSKNFIAWSKEQEGKSFSYNDLGSMATIGRNKAVVDLPYLKFQGFLAWVFWLFVHLMAILGVKNRFFIFLEWMWSYFTFDQSLRLVIKQKKPRNSEAS